MVPTFTCGLVRSNFFFAIAFLSLLLFRPRGLSPPRGSNPRPRPYQGRALPTELGGRSRRSDIKKRLLSATPFARLDRNDYPPSGARPSTNRPKDGLRSSVHPSITRFSRSSHALAGRGG